MSSACPRNGVVFLFLSSQSFTWLWRSPEGNKEDGQKIPVGTFLSSPGGVILAGQMAGCHLVVYKVSEIGSADTFGLEGWKHLH